MTALYIINPLVVLTACWAVWVRRDTLYSRWDAPITIAIGFFGLGAMLDSPWPDLASASFPLTGKYYLLTALGHISILVGASLGLKTVCLRLMADDAVGPFLRNRIRPAIAIAALTMLVCVMASAATTTMSADSLYLVRPDGWLLLYWAAYFFTLCGLNLVALYGATVLRRGGETVMLEPLAAATIVGTLSCLGFLAAIVAGQTDLVVNLIWPASELAIIGGSVACALSWRYRRRALTTPDVD